jgi:hypothetical protein
MSSKEELNKIIRRINNTMHTSHKTMTPEDMYNHWHEIKADLGTFMENNPDVEVNWSLLELVGKLCSASEEKLRLEKEN